jgi:hypothetical protein
LLMETKARIFRHLIRYFTTANSDIGDWKVCMEMLITEHTVPDSSQYSCPSVDPDIDWRYSRILGTVLRSMP